LINIIINILNSIFNLILIPFRMLPQFYGLLFISLVSGLCMILIFSRISDQGKISRLRKRMGGEVLGILLHVSSPRTVIGFAGRLIWSNTLYLGYLLKPLLVIAIPFMLVWGQLDARYGTAAMDEDYPLTVNFQYEDKLPSRESIEIESVGLVLVPPVILIDTLNEASFRVFPEGDSLRSISIAGTDIRIGRTAVWNGCIIQRSFDSGNSLKRLFCPWTGYISRTEYAPASGWYSLPDARYAILGGHWSWIAVFLVFSSLSAIIGAKVFKVKI